MVNKTESKGLTSDETMTAILSYLGILVLIPLFAIDAKKRNDFIKYHLQQGLNLFILEIIIWVIGFILTLITLGIFGYIMYLIWLAVVILSIIAIIKAMNKEKWEFPLLGKIKMVKL